MTGSSGWDIEGEPDDDRSREALTSALQTRTDELQSLAGALSDVLVRLDDDGTIVFANEAVESVLGYDSGTLQGESLSTLLAGERDGSVSPIDVETLLTAASEGGLSERQVPFLGRDGAVVPVSLSVIPLETTAGYICLARDIGQREQRERERQQYAELVETVGDPMYVLDSEGNIERINDAMVEYTGYDRDELVGRSMGEIVPAREYERATSHLTTLTDETDAATTTFETALVTKSGELVISEAKVTVLTDDGSYAGSVGVLRDIRERKQRERDLELLKQVLTRVFRHNVRNDLMLIQGHTDLLEQETDSDIDEHIETIRETCDGLLDHSEKARLIESVIESDELHEIPLSYHVEQVVDSYRTSHPEATFEIDIPDSLTVEANPRLPTATEELIDNALAHAPEDGTPVVSVWIDQHDDAVTLFVEDESGGLNEHEIEVLRQGMETDLQHSSGVGLWLVRWVVEASNADMIAHQTDEGSLMGIKFTQREQLQLGSESPLTYLPEHVSDLVRTGGVSGETVVGQFEELRRLETIYDDLAQRGGHAVFVTGEAGVGKSTLLDRFETHIDEREGSSLVTTGGCERGVTPPYYAVRQALSALPDSTVSFDIEDSADPDDPEMIKRRRQALFAEVADELREVSSDQPVVVLLDDFQWADQATVDLLSYLVDEVGRWALPILFVVTYRTDAVEADHPLVELTDRTVETPRGEHIQLGSFNPADVRNLLTFMLDVEELSDSFVTAVHEHTGGNPLFVTEIGRQLAETVGPDTTQADLPEHVEELSLPASVESAVTERIEELTDSVRQVLELGAVVGKTISLDVLRESSRFSEAELLEYVETLVQRRLWKRSEGTLAFVHGVIRTKTIAGIDSDRRERLHARVADAIEAVYADRLTEQYGQLATHWEAAGEYERALEYARRAGDRATDAYAHETAIEHYERVLDIAEKLPEVETETVITTGHRLAENHLTVNNYDEAADFIAFVREQTPTARPAWRCRSAQLAARLAIQRGNYEEAIAEAETGMAVADEQGVVYCRLLAARAEAEWRKSDYDGAEATSERLRELAAELGRADLEARATEQLARVYQERAEYDHAREQYRAALDQSQRAGDPHLEADAKTGLGVVADRQNHYETALEHFEGALEITESVGDHHQAAKLYNNLANLAIQRGAYDEAREYYEQVLETGERVGDTDLVSVVYFNLSSIVRQRSEFDTAREYVNTALQSWREMDNDHRIAIALLDLGHHTIQTGAYDEAGEHLDEALELARAVGDDLREGKVHWNKGTLARERGAFDRAASEYETGRTMAKSLDNDPLAADIRADEGLLAYRRGDYEQAETHCRAALDVLREEDVLTSVASTLRTLALTASARGDHEQALAHLDEAHQTYSDIGSEHGVARVIHARGIVERRRGNDQQARDAFQAARKTFEAVGLVPDRARASRELGRVAAATGDIETARAELTTSLEACLDIGAVADGVEALSILVEYTDDDHLDSYCDRLADSAADLGAETVCDRVESLRADIAADD